MGTHSLAHSQPLQLRPPVPPTLRPLPLSSTTYNSGAHVHPDGREARVDRAIPCPFLPPQDLNPGHPWAIWRLWPCGGVIVSTVYHVSAYFLVTLAGFNYREVSNLSHTLIKQIWVFRKSNSIYLLAPARIYFRIYFVLSTNSWLELPVSVYLIPVPIY